MDLLNNKKVYIICAKEVYPVAEDYILSFKKLYTNIILFKEIIEIPTITCLNIYIFIQSIPTKLNIDINYKNIYLLNIEQLSRHDQISYIHTLPKNINLIDYSKANMMYYTDYYNSKFLPYQINYDEIYNFQKDRDLCIVLGPSTRRNNIINDFINKGYKIDIISGWKKERDNILFRYKILINIGYNTSYKIFESLRCDRCIFNKMIVISEKKENMDLYHLKDYMIFDDYENIVDKAITVLNNYDMYYNSLHLDNLNLETLPIEPVIPDMFF